MKKHTTRYIVITVVCLLLTLTCVFGAYMYLSGRTKGSENEIIFHISPESIESIKISSNDYEYELEKDDGVWELENNEDKKLVQQSINKALNVFSLIKGTEVNLEAVPVPDIRVEIDAKFSEAEFGLAKVNESYYLITEQGKVYLVSQVLYSVAERKAEYYRDKTITKIKSFGTEGENKFVSYNFKYKNDENKYSEINVRLKNSSEVLKFDTSSQYMMSTPYLRPVDAADFESKVLTKIPQIKIENFVLKESSDLSVYGLDEKTRGVLTVKYDKSAFVLYIGKILDDVSEVYCKLPDSKEIFTVKSSSLDFLGYNSFEFIDKSIFPYNTDYIRSIFIQSEGFDLDIRSDSKNFYIGERPVSKETAHTFFTELKNIKVSSIETKGHISSQLLKITITGSDGAYTVYKVIKTEDDKILVSEKDGVFLKIDPKEFEAFSEYLKQLEKTLI